MTRIVGGRWGGRTLRTPRGSTTRPTAEKIRAALGNALAAGGALEDAVVLDLYAGSGALGLELLSRGAARVVLVERDRAAVAALRQNVAALDPRAAQVVAADVDQWSDGPGASTAGPFDLVVADPPYAVADADLAAVFAALGTVGAMAPGADLVVERGVRRDDPAGPTFGWPAPVAAVREKRYGDTVLCYGRWP